MSEIKYFELMFARLEPRSEWRGGRMADTDVLTLEDAARFASLHSGEEVTPGDVLRAAARREILLHAIVHRAAKVHAHDGGVYCNKGEPTENLVPEGSIPTLPLSACQSLAATGRARWRTFDGIKTIDGEMVRFTKAMLDDGEPDFETVPADCRVTGYDVHALADAYCAPEDEPQAAAPEPKASPEWQALAQKRARAIIKEHKARDLYLPQIRIAEMIADEFRRDGVMGTDGKPLSGATIKRHAFKGISSAQDRQLSTAPRRGK